MDWYPLWNSLRIAAIACVIVFFSGIALAYYVARLPRVLKGILDVVLTLPLVLPPTVCGWLLLLVFGLQHPVGIFLNEAGIRFVMTWYGGVLASAVVAFPPCTARRGGLLKASMKHWLGVERPWGCRTPLFSGISACPTANRASWPARSWPLPELSANMGRRACLSAISPSIRRPFRRRCTNYGGPMMSTVPSFGSWSTSPSVPSS